MTLDEITRFGTWRVAITIVVSASVVFIFVAVTFVCACLPWTKGRTDDEEQMLKGTVHASEGERKQSALDSVKDFTMQVLGKSRIDKTVIRGVDYNLGRILMSIVHSDKHKELSLKIFRVIDLPPKDTFSGLCDPYVAISVLPEQKKQFKTKIIKNKLSPVWNESFQFTGWTRKMIRNKTLLIQVMDYDRFTKDEFMGELYISLNTIDLSCMDAIWYFLQPCKGTNVTKLGELLVALCYSPKEERLIVRIVQARDVKPMDIMGASDPYVKVHLIVHGEIIEKRKTAHKKNSSSPMYNESFLFHIDVEDLYSIHVDCILMDFDDFSGDDKIGAIRLGPKGGPSEKRHWQEMLSNPLKTIESWHAIKSGIDDE